MNSHGASAEMFTVGHSTRDWNTFVEILQAFGIEQLVDVRTIPRSRRHPQFNSEEMAATLPRAGIRYIHMPKLGGLRRARPNSENLGWQNPSFRGYADYMQTPEFAAAADDLIKLGGEGRTAVMCAEAVPWRCHRSLLSDALVARGAAVEHILSATSHRPHSLTPFARVSGTSVRYPAPLLEP